MFIDRLNSRIFARVKSVESSASIDEWRLFERAELLGLRFGCEWLGAFSWFGPLQGQRREIGDAIDQVIFEHGGAALIAAENFQHAQENPVWRENRAGGKNLEADLQGAVGHGAEMILGLLRQGDDGDYVADANIYHHAEFVEDAGQRSAEGNQFEDLALADELAAAIIGGLAMRLEVKVRPLGARLFGHAGPLSSIMLWAIAGVAAAPGRARRFLPGEFSYLLR